MNGNSILPIAVPVAAYLLGAIPFGLLLGRILGGADVRRFGSGNIGATNVSRSLGPGIGILTLILDVAKGSLSAWAGGRFLGGIEGASLAGLAAIFGHVFPVYLGFRGGKGVATGLGAFVVLDPRAAGWAIAAFLGMVLITRRVSAGSLLASVSLPVILHFRGAPPALLIAAWTGCLLIVVRHRDNLRRLLSGTEPRLGARDP